jgi:Zn-dependent protease
MEDAERQPEAAGAVGEPGIASDTYSAPSSALATKRAEDRVLAEIDRLERKQSSWVTALLTLVVSGLLFYWIGRAIWSWKFAALVIPILLFHEMGHYLAMRVFRYRNLRMFFIPLFGAAVIGRHHNVPAWKKGVVSLMGPLPGIGVGTALGIVALYYHQKPLLEAATLMVFLNGFNLLPILPLDGGWNLHAILFSRHVVLDVGFRLVAAVALVAGAVYLRQQFLTYFGIVILIALPPTIRIALVAARLRREGLAAESPDSQSVPEGTARRIIGEVRSAFPTRMNDKSYARIALQIFESLNARPAGWFATMALGGAHLAGFSVSLVAASVFFLAGRTDLGQFIRAAAEMPTNVFTCGTTLKWRGARALGAHKPHITLIGTFTDRKKGEQAFHDLAGQLPATASATLFGQSIFVTLPQDAALRKEWEARLRAPGLEIGVEDKKSSAICTLSCIAPNDRAANVIEHEIRAYLAFASSRNLIPAWSTTQALTDAQHKARSTYSKIQEIQRRRSNSSRLWSWPERLRRTPKTKEEFAKFREAMMRSRRESLAAALDEVRRQRDSANDLELARLYEAWALHNDAVFRDAETSRALRQQMAERMGTFPLENGKPKPEVERESAVAGQFVRTGLLLRFDWISFKETDVGLPALAEWLCANQCVQIRYNLEPFLDDPSQDEANASGGDE